MRHGPVRDHRRSRRGEAPDRGSASPGTRPTRGTGSSESFTPPGPGRSAALGGDPQPAASPATRIVSPGAAGLCRSAGAGCVDSLWNPRTFLGTSCRTTRTTRRPGRQLRGGSGPGPWRRPRRRAAGRRLRHRLADVECAPFLPALCRGAARRSRPAHGLPAARPLGRSHGTSPCPPRPAPRASGRRRSPPKWLGSQDEKGGDGVGGAEGEEGGGGLCPRRHSGHGRWRAKAAPVVEEARRRRLRPPRRFPERPLSVHDRPRPCLCDNCRQRLPTRIASPGAVEPPARSRPRAARDAQQRAGVGGGGVAAGHGRSRRSPGAPGQWFARGRSPRPKAERGARGRAP